MSESSANESPHPPPPIDPPGSALPAEDSPVPAGPATLPMGGRVQTEADRLVLRSPVGCSAPFIIGLFLLPAAFALGGLFLPNLARPGPAGFALLVVPLFFAWVWYRQIVLPCVAFDKQAGALVLGWRGRRGRRPLSSVVGVQVMPTRRQFGNPETSAPVVLMCQMNLILDDPAERRLNVLTCDAGTARSTARKVADFLGVPVLDAEAPAVPAAGAPGPPPPEVGTVMMPVVVARGPDVLLIRPRRLAMLSGISGLSLVGTAMLCFLLASQPGPPDWSTVLIEVALACSPFAFFLVLLQALGQRALFDRGEGLLRLGWMNGRGAARPLASFKAVEVVSSLAHEMNLVSDDPQRPRLNLITHADGALVRGAAEQVASFLGVPLLAGGRPVPAAGANPLGGLSRLPLTEGRATIRGPAAVVPEGEEVLILRPRSRPIWVRLAVAVIATAVEIYVIWIVWFAAGAQVGLGWPALFVLLGVLPHLVALKPLLLYRDRFDRQAGVLTLGWYGLKGTCALDGVLAVQLVPGGLVNQLWMPFRRGGERVSYQINLALGDAKQDRLHLTDDCDLAWTRGAGRQIADFLGVPLLDQIADGD